jgi:hypothetical protein
MAVLEASAWIGLGLAVLVISAAIAGSGEPAPAAARLIARIWLVGSLLLPILLLVVPPWRRTGDLAALARAVDDRTSATADSLLTAVDLAGALDAGTLTDDPETLRLAHRQLAAAAERADSVDARSLVPWSMLATARQAGPVGLVFLVIAFVGLPDDARTGLDRLFGPVATEATADEPEEEPVTLVLRNVSIRLTPPAYSGREPLALEGTTGDFQALPGTAVVIEADTPIFGRSARLIWGGVLLSEAIVKGKHLTFHFNTPARGSGTYMVRLKRGIGGGEFVTRTFRVDALPDKAPELEVVGPTTAIELRPGQTVPLEIRTSDDFGLTRLERVIERGGREIARFPIAIVAGRTEATERLRWDPLEDLARPGGELSLIIEAYDNDTVNGPKLTRSRPVEIYIPTARDQHRKVLALQERLLDVALDLLAEILVDREALRLDVRSYNRRDLLLGQHDREAGAATQLFAVAERLGDQMRRDRLSRPASFVGTGRVMENVARRWSALEEYVEREIRNLEGTGVNPAVVAQLGRLRDDATDELEQAVLDLADFVDLDRAVGAVADLADLDAELSELADLVREGVDGGLVDDERIEAALQALEEAMARLAKKLEERRGGPDDGFQNRLPADADRSLRDKVRKLLDEGKYEEALALMQKAQDSLAKLSDSLQGEMNSMAGSQNSEELNRAMQAAIDETRELEHRQRELLEQTEGLVQKFGSGDGLDPEEQEAILREMAVLLKEITAIPGAIDDEVLLRRARRGSERARRAAEGMRSAFAEGGLEEAIALGLQAERELDITRDGIAAGARREEAVSGAAASARRAASAGGRAQALIETLEAAQARAAQQRARAGRGGEGTRRGQNGLAGDLAGLRRRVEGMGGSAFNPVSGRDNLRSAEDLMLRAGSRLEQGRPGRARGAQAGAIQQLEQFRGALEEAQAAMQQGGMPGGDRKSVV